MCAFMLCSGLLAANRMSSVAAYVSTLPGVASGSVCSPNLTATASGQLFTVTCPALAGARYVTLRRAAGSILAMSELSLFSASGAAAPCCPRTACTRDGSDHAVGHTQSRRGPLFLEGLLGFCWGLGFKTWSIVTACKLRERGVSACTCCGGGLGAHPSSVTHMAWHVAAPAVCFSACKGAGFGGYVVVGQARPRHSAYNTPRASARDVMPRPALHRVCSMQRNCGDGAVHLPVLLPGGRGQ